MNIRSSLENQHWQLLAFKIISIFFCTTIKMSYCTDETNANIWHYASLVGMAIKPVDRRSVGPRPKWEGNSSCWGARDLAWNRAQGEDAYLVQYHLNNKKIYVNETVNGPNKCPGMARLKWNTEKFHRGHEMPPHPEPFLLTSLFFWSTSSNYRIFSEQNSLLSLDKFIAWVKIFSYHDDLLCLISWPLFCGEFKFAPHCLDISFILQKLNNFYAIELLHHCQNLLLALLFGYDTN